MRSGSCGATGSSTPAASGLAIAPGPTSRWPRLPLPPASAGRPSTTNSEAATRFLDAVEQAIDEHSRDPLAALTAALEGFLTIAHDDPLVRLLLTDDGMAGLLPLVTTQRRPILNSARRRLVEAIDAHWPGAAARDLDALADALVRLAISHVAAPHLPPAQTAASITRLLAPAIERMLKGGGEPAA